MFTKITLVVQTDDEFGLTADNLSAEIDYETGSIALYPRSEGTSFTSCAVLEVADYKGE